jgi:hypothetical protein
MIDDALIKVAGTHGLRRDGSALLTGHCRVSLWQDGSGRLLADTPRRDRSGLWPPTR